MHWGPGSGVLPPEYKGKDKWDGDQPDDDHKDVKQDKNLPQLFVIDGPGCPRLEYKLDHRFSCKGKFQEWVEVKIGGKWYVCSAYHDWHNIQHLKYVVGPGGQMGWSLDTSKTNEVLKGTIPGWPKDWSED